MKAGDPLNSIATDPVKRMIRVHAKSIVRARKLLKCDNAACGPCDPNQCRLIVNALRREIDRLMRGVDRSALCYRPPFACTLKTRPGGDCNPECNTAPDNSSQSASAPQARKSYAVAALGPPLATPTPDAAANASAYAMNFHSRISGDKLIDLLA